MLEARTYADEVEAVAREYMGVEWRHQGRTTAGIDCVGLVLVVGWRLGFIPDGKDVPAYGRRAQPLKFLHEFHNNLDPIRVDEVQYGDVVIQKVSRVVSHCGLVCKGDRGLPIFLHAEAARAKVMEEPYLGGINMPFAFRYRSVA